MAVKTYSYAKDQNIKLSAHFRVGEFRSYSDSQKKLTSDVIRLDDNLVPTLEQLFDYLACSKIIVSSGYRSADFEKYLGGNPTTGQHCKGTAADIICYGKDGKKIDPKTVCCAGQALGVTGIGYMTGGTHIDVRPSKSWFDETKKNKVVSDWYSYFGLAKPTQSKPVTSAPAFAVKTYTVKKGDSWWKIAKEQLGSGTKCYTLAKYNGKTIASSLYPGNILKIPQ